MLSGTTACDGGHGIRQDTSILLVSQASPVPKPRLQESSQGVQTAWTKHVLMQGLEIAQAGGVPREPLEAPRTLDAVRLGLALDTSGGLAGAMLSEVEASLRNPVRSAFCACVLPRIRCTYTPPRWD